MSAYAALRSVAEIPSSRRSRLALAACLGVLAVIASMGLLAASGYLIVRASEMPPVLQLTTVIVTVRFFGTSRAVLRYAERLASHDLAFRQLADIRQAFYKRLVPLLPGTLREARSGDLLSRFVADVDQLQELYLRVLLPPLVAGGSVLVAGLVAGVVMPLAAVVLTAALVLAATVVPWVSARVARLSSERQAAARAQLSNELVEALDGSAELALLGQSRSRLRRIGAADAELARYARRDALASGAATALGGVVSGIGIAGVLAAAAKQLAACRVSADRLEEITERAPLVVDPVDALPLAAGSPAVLSVRSVHARAVLRGVDLDLEPGRAVALVGESGSGKTTLAELLVRFAAPDAGVIELAGVDIKALAQAELRKHVLLCAQDAHVFSTTIAANLRLAAPGATDDQLADALHAVGLGQFVDSLPDGVDTLTGQDGAQLSGG
ncbi:MAG TPA: ATP-binding cassette domain-containing protein, partial [Baekduia sp.]|nr:ATP-binding cassette domain-containing protein [Baekduia sp.]